MFIVAEVSSGVINWAYDEIELLIHLSLMIRFVSSTLQICRHAQMCHALRTINTIVRFRLVWPQSNSVSCFMVVECEFEAKRHQMKAYWLRNIQANKLCAKRKPKALVH